MLDKVGFKVVIRGRGARTDIHSYTALTSHYRALAH